MPTPILVNFTAYANATITSLPEAQQETAKSIFDTCCAAQGACAPWDQASENAGYDFTKGEVLYDLCNIDNNLCDDQGNLISLNLDGYQLVCDVASLDFSNFTSLKYLSMAENNITGDFDGIMSKVADQLPGLEYLDLGANPAITGSINTINTTENTQNTPGICSLVSGGLKWMGLYQTQATGPFPDCFFQEGSALEEVWAGFANISGSLPSTFSSSSNLTVFSVEYSSLEGPIPALPGALVKLNLTENGHTGGVPSLATRDNYLTSVDLSNNNLTGPVPDSAGDHPSLRFLDLRANGLDALPQAWVNAGGEGSQSPPLDTILLSNNPVQSTFPTALSTYPNLTILDLGDAQITGEFPAVPSGGFAALDQLYLENNQLTGGIDESWGASGVFSSRNLDRYAHAFILANNSLDGTLPQFLLEPNNDVIIDLNGNNFSNACDPSFEVLQLCPNATGTSPLPSSSPPSGGGASPEGADDSGGGGGGLSGGEVAAIVIVCLLVAGVGGFFLWRRHQNKKSAGSFQRFEDEAGFVEMGQRSGSAYNPQLAP